MLRRLFWSEVIGSALLVLGGLSLVIFMFGTGTPMARILPSEGWRRLITGFFFGGTGALIAISPVGKASGAHINPAVTLAFRWMGKLDTRTSLVYIAGQCLGGILGCVPLLAWGNMGKSIAYGATTPGAGYSILAALTGEFLATFLMVALLAVFLGFRRIRPFTPGIFPPLFAILVWAEAPISGTSANPARSLGPSVISGQWQCGWIYWVGPILGSLVACLLCSALARRITEAKLYYFDSDQDRLFRRCYGFSGPWAERGGLEQHGQCVTGFNANEGSPDRPINPPTYLLNDVMAGIEASIGMLEALRRRAREGGSYLVRVSLARNCSWVQDFGLFPENEVRGVGLPESIMTEPGLQAKIRPEFDLPLVTATGPLGEVSVVPPQVEFSDFRLGPRFSGESNGASKLDWSVFTQEMPEKKGRTQRPELDRSPSPPGGGEALRFRRKAG